MMRSPLNRLLDWLAATLLVWALVVPSLHLEHGDHEDPSDSHDCVYCHPAQGSSILMSDVVVVADGDELVETRRSTDEHAHVELLPETALPRGPPVTA